LKNPSQKGLVEWLKVKPLSSRPSTKKKKIPHRRISKTFCCAKEVKVRVHLYGILARQKENISDTK
jgi:hypothetical protein